MFTAQALKRYVTSNTHNPHCNSFHQEIWDISRLFTHLSCTTFPSSLRILHFFCLWGLANRRGGSLKKKRLHI